MTATLDNDDWDRAPTALEAAHYDALLLRANDKQARLAHAEAEAKKVIFGECLAKLIGLGVKEQQARGLLGKWRGQAKDDRLLIRIIEHASRTVPPDPVPYITKAIGSNVAKAAGNEDRVRGTWTLIGWEKPRSVRGGAIWRGEERGQVWIDPFGKRKVLPAPKGTATPTIDQDPGVDVETVK